MDMGLEGKVVVITGGTAGIGKSLIPAFLAEGCKVVACGRTPQQNAAVQQEFPAAKIVAADVSRDEDLHNLAKVAADTFGGIDIWINNAGVMLVTRLLDITPEQWDTQMNINVRATLRATQIAVPYMEKRGGGVIINASSFSTVIPSANTGAYAISKIALNNMTRVFAAELAPKNIRVVSYLPGMIDTPLNSGVIAANGEKLLEPIPLKRFGLSEEVAPAVVFLASSKAAYITGTTLEVTGGKFCVQNASAVKE